jgi:hypothetical protein
LFCVLKIFHLLSLDHFRFACGCWNYTAVPIAAPLPEKTAGEALLPEPSRCRRKPRVASAVVVGAKISGMLGELWAFAFAPDAVGAVISALLLLATEVLSILHRLSSDWERTISGQ